MKQIKLDVGDVLLYPREKILDIEDYIAKVIGKKATEWLARVINYRYAHAELYVGGGYLLAAWYNGIALYKPKLATYAIAHIYRHPDITDEHRLKIKDLVKLFLQAKGYDYTSFILNAVVEMLSFDVEVIENYLESKFPLDDPTRLICSELIARIYQRIGLPIERNPEFVTPDDLSEWLERVV